MVPGPQTSWVMSMSTLTQTFSLGVTCDLARVLGQDLFGHGHAGHVYISCEVRFLETRKYSGADGGLPTSDERAFSRARDMVEMPLVRRIDDASGLDQPNLLSNSLCDPIHAHSMVSPSALSQPRGIAR